jgi:hypothetical protein
MLFADLKCRAERVIDETSTDPWWFLRGENDALMVATIRELIRVAEMREAKAHIAAIHARTLKRQLDVAEYERDEAMRDWHRLDGRVMELELDLQTTEDNLYAAQESLNKAQEDYEY